MYRTCLHGVLRWPQPLPPEIGDALPVRENAAVAESDDQGRAFRRARQPTSGLQFVRGLRNQVAVDVKHVRRSRDWKIEEPRQHGVETEQLIFEAGHDPEVAAAATNRPEEIRMLARIRHDKTPIRQDYLRCQHVVAHRAIARHQHVLASAEGQAAEANVRASTGRRHEPIRLPCRHG